mmetsp:Transcript_2860/g.8974  ORF Transcript_2860/g.8974 Transcript_2860/m.8974 type:complete len:819 (+) Transcript_2860:175-2631(+)
MSAIYRDVLQSLSLLPVRVPDSEAELADPNDNNDQQVESFDLGHSLLSSTRAATHASATESAMHQSAASAQLSQKDHALRGFSSKNSGPLHSELTCCAEEDFQKAYCCSLSSSAPSLVSTSPPVARSRTQAQILASVSANAVGDMMAVSTTSRLSASSASENDDDDDDDSESNEEEQEEHSEPEEAHKERRTAVAQAQCSTRNGLAATEQCHRMHRHRRRHHHHHHHGETALRSEHRRRRIRRHHTADVPERAAHHLGGVARRCDDPSYSGPRLRGGSPGMPAALVSQSVNPFEVPDFEAAEHLSLLARPVMHAPSMLSLTVSTLDRTNLLAPPLLSVPSHGKHLTESLPPAAAAAAAAASIEAHAPPLSALCDDPAFAECEYVEPIQQADARQPCYFQLLPAEIILQILLRLDSQSFCRSMQVCRYFFEITQCSPAWRKRNSITWERTVCLINSCAQITHDIFNSDVEPAYERRIRFLLETLKEMQQRFLPRILAPVPNEYNVDSYHRLVGVLIHQLEQTILVTWRIRSCKAKITRNFDMLDLAIRRYADQLEIMYPLPVTETEDVTLTAPRSYSHHSELTMSSTNDTAAGVYTRGQKQKKKQQQKSTEPGRRGMPVPASSVIVDPDARALWDEAVGADVCIVDFPQFYDRVLVKRFPSLAGDTHFRDFFSFFVNFPRDNLLTTYKWGVITGQFGPLPVFVENFRRYACRNGFLGLINSVDAEEQLHNYRRTHTGDFYLIRFSRKEPEKLTFSYSTNGRYHHRRLPLDTPLQSFVAYYERRSIKPLNAHLNRSITQIHRVWEYCENSGYFLDSTIPE